MSDVLSFTPRTPRAADNVPTACLRYLEHKRSHGVAQATITAYGSDLQLFAGFLAAADILTLQQVRVQDVEDFIAALIDGEGNSPRTAARRLATVKGFFKWAAKRNLVAHNVADQAEPLRFHIPKVVGPSVDAVQRFLAAIDTSTRLGVRDRAMFQLMADTALRVGGLQSLDLHDPDQVPLCGVRPNGIVSYQSKGGKIKETVYTADATARWLARWIEVRPLFQSRRPCPALFLTERGTRVSRQSIQARIKLWASAAGMPALHCHLLRHSRIGDAIERGDLHLAHLLAGHENKSTTADMYGAQAASKLRNRLRREAPFGDSAEDEPCAL